MNKPCDKCLVKMCCSAPCREYAEYVYSKKEYCEAGRMVADKIDQMTHEEAIEHILKVESVYFYMKTISAPVAQSG